MIRFQSPLVGTPNRIRSLSTTPPNRQIQEPHPHFTTNTKTASLYTLLFLILFFLFEYYLNSASITTLYNPFSLFFGTNGDYYSNKHDYFRHAYKNLDFIDPNDPSSLDFSYQSNPNNNNKHNYNNKNNNKHDTSNKEYSSQHSQHSVNVELRESLIEKERLLIEKEEKYNNALSELNDRDLKLNYIDRQLIKIQKLLNGYKDQTRYLKKQLFFLNQRHNSTVKRLRWFEYQYYKQIDNSTSKIDDNTISMSNENNKHKHLRGSRLGKNKNVELDSEEIMQNLKEMDIQHHIAMDNALKSKYFSSKLKKSNETRYVYIVNYFFE